MLQANRLSVFDHFVGLALKELKLKRECTSISVTFPLYERTQVQTGIRGFYLPYSPQKLFKLRHESTCYVFSKKSSEFLFLLVLFSARIYLFEVWLKGFQNGYIYFFLFLFSSGIYLFKLSKTTGSFSKATILTNKDHLVLFFFQGLHITCKSYYNLSIQRGNYQLD